MSEDKDANIYVVEQVEISSDSDTEELLEDIHELEDLQNSLDDIQELEGLMRSTLKRSQLATKYDEEPKNFQPKHVRRLEVVDDYIRNFLIRNNMTTTLNSFQVPPASLRKNGTSASSRRKTSPTLRSKTKCSRIRSSS